MRAAVSQGCLVALSLTRFSPPISSDSEARLQRILPLLWGFTGSSILTFILVGGPPLLRPRLRWPWVLLIFLAGVAALSALAALVAIPLSHRLVPASSHKRAGSGSQRRPLVSPDGRAVAESDQETPLEGSEDGSTPTPAAYERANPAAPLDAHASAAEEGDAEGTAGARACAAPNSEVDREFVPLMVASACSVAFARALPHPSPPPPPFPDHREPPLASEDGAR